jgi:hypothetical protein
MVAHLGGTRIMGVLLTMDGRQGAELVRLVEPRMTVPVHTDDYTVFRSSLSDFFVEVAQREVPSEIRTVAGGERMALGLPTNPHTAPEPTARDEIMRWWTPVPACPSSAWWAPGSWPG